MGQVYRARDTRLRRDVALKILPDGFAADADRVARFQREAELLATLNHPNIAGIYGLEQADGVRALVLELVDGPTLADRIALGPLPVDEALLIAGQIADALEAAHEKGVIHRDLKPANIKLTTDDRVKVLDFGLAKMLENPAAPATLSMSPTLSVHATYAGVILGTAAYMSPEQARGKAVDKRSDIWAFGCVLYEVLTGTPPFQGEDVAEVIGAIIHKEIAWDRLPPGTPAVMQTVLTRCLEKDLRKRVRDVGDVQLALNGAFETPRSPSRPERQSPKPTSWIRRVIVTVGAALSLAAAVGITWWTVHPSAAQPIRFALVPPSSQPLLLNTFDRAIAISPDGRYIAYVEGVMGARRLMLRPVDQLDAVPLRNIGGTVNAVTPFFDPDSRWVGFFEAGEMKKVAVTGGPPITICKVTNPRGASWGPDNTIVFGSGDLSTGLLSVIAAGGEPKVLTKPDVVHGERDHLFPSFLPGGRSVLFTITTDPVDKSQLAVLDLKTGAKRTLVQGGSQPEYVETGQIVYAAVGTLRAVRFDLERLDVHSDPIPIVDKIAIAPSGAANFAVSRTGTLVYAPGDIAADNGALRSLVWIDRQGHEQPIMAPQRTYTTPRLSPDGTRLAVHIRDQEDDIWVFDFRRQTLERRTFDAARDDAPLWTPDGRRLLFSSARTGALNLYWQQSDGTGSVERLTSSGNAQFPASISPDGTLVAFVENATSSDINLLDLSKDATHGSRTRPLIHTMFNDTSPEISPDGTWIAYESNESGMNQVYVRPFPNVDAGHWQISASGGEKPLWARNGRELFYVDPTNRTMMSVAVQATGTTFGPGSATKLFAMPYYLGQTARTYDASTDGQHFLMIKDAPASERRSPASTTPASLIVVVNWLEELKQRVTAK
jgi:serine/threonine-protein kinase